MTTCRRQDESDYGIYVYESAFKPVRGDRVSLVGQISEYHGLTELSHVNESTTILLSSGNALPSPLPLTTGDLGERHEGILLEVPPPQDRRSIRPIRLRLPLRCV